MEREIEEMLNTPLISPSEEEIRVYLIKINNKIFEYEKIQFENDTYDLNLKKITEWQSKILSQIRNLTHKKEYTMTQEENELFDVVKLASKQVDKADYNINLLGKSGLKLQGLNYSLEEVEKEIEETKANIVKNKYEEGKEEKMLYLGMIVFILSCLFVIIDKYII